tara:strand:+ start:40 stop:267 length:228 start_codon:yes stop_codon:yes gene_type:complete
MGLILISFLISSETEKEIGRYQLETLTYTSKKGTVYIVETILDTKTGKIVKRQKKKASSYKLPYKGSRGQMIYED